MYPRAPPSRRDSHYYAAHPGGTFLHLAVKTLMWRYSSSPLLYRDKLYIEVLLRADPKVYKHAIDDKPQRESFLSCLDPQTGGELWRQVRKTDALGESQDAYSSPVVRQSARGAEIVVSGPIT